MGKEPYEGASNPMKNCCMTGKFLRSLNMALFAKEREKEFGSQKEMDFAYSAVRFLWRRRSITCCGWHLSRSTVRKLLLDEILPEDINGALRDIKENGLPMTKDTFAYVLTATILGRDNAVRYVIEQDRKRGLIA